MTKEDVFECREKFLINFFLEVLDYQDSDATIKIYSFQLKALLEVLVSDSVDHAVAELHKLENGAK